MDLMWIVWLIIALIFLVLEVVTVALVSLWFIVGAVVALIASLFGANLLVQIVLFLVVSLLLLFIFYKNKERWGFTSKTMKRTNADRLIGMTAEVIKKVEKNENIGLAKVSGQVWSISSQNNEVLEVGTLVKVNDIQGVRLIVERINN